MKITEAKIDAILKRQALVSRDLRALTTGNYRAADEAILRHLRDAERRSRDASQSILNARIERWGAP